MRRDHILSAGLFLAMLASRPVFASGAQQTQQAPSHPVIWVDRGNASELDLIAGSGQKKQEPGTKFTFIKESISGTSPKFDVEDENGVKWKVKLGLEVKSETAATRLVWAAGYFVDDDYYRDEIHVEGMKHLKRGQNFVHKDGTVVHVRLERHRSGPDPMPWDWYGNPFSGTKELNGLRVVMALINNWDLKAVNNAVYIGKDGNATYAISDLGGSLGRTGDPFMRSKGIAKDYAASSFIDKVTAEYVNFTMRSQPFFLTIFNFQNFRMRSKIESIAHRVPIEDARWIGTHLGELSSTQIGDCFRAGGFSTTEVDTYTQAVMKRIAALKSL